MRIKGSIVLAGILAVGAVAWIVSGQMGDNKPATASQEAPKITAPPADAVTRVRVRDIAASPFVASVVTSGHTEAVRIVTLKAETAGRVIATPTPKGATVDAGAEIVRIDEADRPARLEEAKARIAQRQMEHNAASKLAAKGFQAETTLAGAKAELEAAKSERRTIEVDLERTRIQAPVDGILDDRMVEVGDYVAIGDEVATVVELDPLLITAQIAERQAPQIEVGMPAHARLSTGDERIGVVSYVSAVADESTRTFRLEIEVDNEANQFGQGLSAEIQIDLPATNGHRVTPSIFRLDELGRVGVMTVDSENRARFTPVTIIGIDDQGTWVSGLPETVRVIVVGQDLVEDGEVIEPVTAGDGASS
ncbi:efflux RND transporter periplasmic adaptor subunit [Thalassobaculum litoreum]|uniref:Membrane fusion protein, multidrug efflux system n=1 Tax=Thalassobaculum litoreum DSM 18839 TaxID=1123362 RepID=A0A8G2F147_9PROT|nr:efflux RND transporter periplasmic adaptor subunit [Thalassobaculum litoreum]SDF06357.1 membrane fusion protein, multidrug efflux system [Thalassobaculum litoreum DSM 18839]